MGFNTQVSRPSRFVPNVTALVSLPGGSEELGVSAATSHLCKFYGYTSSILTISSVLYGENAKCEVRLRIVRLMSNEWIIEQT
jgi:hypothetical protein